MKLVYLIARLLFGLWFVYSGIKHFVPGAWQPIGNTAEGREFTLALIHSGLFVWIKAVEVPIGLAVLANRYVLPSLLFCAPITAIIAWWNFVLEPGVVEYVFAILTVACNAVLLWPYRALLWPLLEKRGVGKEPFV